MPGAVGKVFIFEKTPGEVSEPALKTVGPWRSNTEKGTPGCGKGESEDIEVGGGRHRPTIC